MESLLTDIYHLGLNFVMAEVFGVWLAVIVVAAVIYHIGTHATTS